MLAVTNGTLPTRQVQYKGPLRPAHTIYMQVLRMCAKVMRIWLPPSALHS